MLQSSTDFEQKLRRGGVMIEPLCATSGTKWWELIEDMRVSEILKLGERNQIDAFAMQIDDMARADLEQLHALSISVGWPHRPQDWQFLRDVGKGVVAIDDIGRIMSSAMWFRQSPELATIGMVITSPRLQTHGTGLWLMEYALQDLDGIDLRLNATRAAQRLYLSLDFVPEKIVYQCQGIVTDAPFEQDFSGDLRVLGADDLAAVTALDAAAFGVVRSGVIEKLMAHSRSYGLFHDGVLKAFALCRRFGRGHVVGPIVASNDEEAVAVVSPHIRDHEGRFLRLDTHYETGDFALFVQRSGLTVYDTVLTMSRGKRLADFATEGTRAPVTYSLASQTLG